MYKTLGPCKFLIADEDIRCSLCEVLVFFSGCDRILPMGFDRHPILSFNRYPSKILPTSSTCDFLLRIPICFDQYENFKEYMVLGLKGNDGFGGV